MATSGRVILHLDLDCFYCESLTAATLLHRCFSRVALKKLPLEYSFRALEAFSLFELYFARKEALQSICRAGQVEQKRLQIKREVPAAVQQWVRTCQP